MAKASLRFIARVMASKARPVSSIDTHRRCHGDRVDERRLNVMRVTLASARVTGFIL